MSAKEYENLKKQLHTALQKKKVLDKQLTQIEEEIFQRENHYLNDSSGNIVRGFENLKAGQPSTGHSASAAKKKLVFTDDDRVFSLSSHTFVRHLQKRDQMEDDDDDSEPTVPKRKR